ncbi:glycosyltransferase family 2 protein [Pedobacter terrae]|uniref:glycosyltransferase family 2 protein n=1 Tax=Pedobacter terrae TaxID=405671 RepID=UPI002FFB9683
MIRISGSIVLYNTPIEQLNKLIHSFGIKLGHMQIYAVDNSPTALLRPYCERANLVYIHTPSNPGFGAGHNIAVDLALKAGSQYHFIINPDIYFNTDVVSPMVAFMALNPQVGMIMPEILNDNGTVQYLPKLLPNPFWIIRRKLHKFDIFYDRFIAKYELREIPRNKIYEAPILSGCFTLLNLSAIKEIGCYDERFFMYFEDWDLSRRMNEKYKTIYFPSVSVYHGYQAGANKNKRLFKIFLNSAISYFSKWGWIDKRRKIINNKVLNQDLDQYQRDESLN